MDLGYFGRDCGLGSLSLTHRTCLFMNNRTFLTDNDKAVDNHILTQSLVLMVCLVQILLNKGLHRLKGPSLPFACPLSTFSHQCKTKNGPTPRSIKVTFKV